MSGASGVESLPEGPSEEDGRAELLRIYDRVEALLPRVEELAADRASLAEVNRTQQERSEFLHARLLQAEESRRRWKTAYTELPLLANPKIAELEENDRGDLKSGEALFEVDNSGEENDREDSRSGEALLDVDNSRPKIHLKKVRDCVDLSQNSEYNDDIARDLRAELRTLKQAYESLTTKEDKEYYDVLAVKDFLLNEFRTSDQDNTALLKKKEVDEEAAQKLQQLVEETQVEARKKDNEIERLQAEASDAKEKKLILEGKLRELNSLVKEKTKKSRRMQRRLINETGRLQAEAFDAKEKLRMLKGEIEEIRSLAKKEISELQKNVQPKSVKCKCTSSLSNETSQKRRKDTSEMHRPMQRRKSGYHAMQMQIFVRTIDGETIALEVKSSYTICRVKAEIQDKEGTPARQQGLVFGSRLLEGGGALEDHGIQENSTLQLVLGGMHIGVRTLVGNVMTLEVDGWDTIAVVKARVFEQTRIPPDYQDLHLLGEQLEEDRTLADCNMRNGSVLDLVLRLPLHPKG